MNFSKITVLVTALFLFNVNASTLVFPESGFSIESLDAKPSAIGSQPLQMLLPAQNGFSANVNVQVQPYKGTITEYKQLSEAQFKQIGITLISKKEMGNTLIIEYSGTMQGQELHWYAKAVKKGDHVYLITATDNKNNWEQHKEQLINNVNSFKLM
ncbi:hypothetical protein [Pseudocolwellia agarivorans]|uniref:hypothetical protein n=1 Tax=Pseudocolwellia agarivorans TaxID=1911682 RepID=UPI000986D2FD|nr:hypothetical protein [Pseudocolwellia agarivorans]